MQQPTHTFQYPKVTPVAAAQAAGTSKPASTSAAAKPPVPAR
jgi:hypothetical protein